MLVLTFNTISCKQENTKDISIPSINVNKTKVEVQPKIDTIYTDLPNPIEFGSGLYFGMSLTEWNRKIAEQTEQGMYNRVQRLNDGSLIAIIDDPDKPIFHKGIFKNIAERSFNICEITRYNNKIISEPVLIGIHVRQDGLTKSEVISHYDNKKVNWQFLAGLDYAFNEYKPCLFENNELHRQYWTTDNFGELRKDNKVSYGVMEEGIKYDIRHSTNYIYTSKFYLPVNPTDFMTEDQINKINMYKESKRLINDALNK